MIYKLGLFALVSLGINAEANSEPNLMLVKDIQPPSKVLQLRTPGNTRVLSDDQYEPTMFKSKEVFGAKDNQTVVYLTGYRSVVEMGLAHHVLLKVCKNLTDFGEKLFGVGASTGGNDFRVFNDAGFAIDFEEYPYVKLEVHFSHPALVAEDTLGMDVVYQYEAPGYETRILIMTSSEILIPADTPDSFVDVNCLVDTPVPIYVWKIELHTHHLGRMLGVFVYNEERDEFRTLAQGLPYHHYAPTSLNHTILPGEYLATRCAYNSTGEQEDTYFGNKGTREMCIATIKYKISTQTSEKFKFWKCLNTMKNQMSEKLSKELPYDNISIIEPRSYDGLEWGSD